MVNYLHELHRFIHANSQIIETIMFYKNIHMNMYIYYIINSCIIIITSLINNTLVVAH